jgi:hypothetical protein
MTTDKHILISCCVELLGLFILVAHFVKAASVKSDLLLKSVKTIDLVNKASWLSESIANRLSSSVGACIYLLL